MTEQQLSVDAQAYPTKIYFQFVDIDRDEPDLQQNCAISYDEAAELWQVLRAAWLTSAGKEDLKVLAGNVQAGDLIMGYDVSSVFIDMSYAVIHLFSPQRGTQRKITLFADDMVEVMRDIS